MSERDDRGNLPSASSMDRCAHCPGSWQAERGIGELPTADQSQQDGVDIHEALETGDDEDLGLTQKQIAEKLRSMEAREVDNWRAAFNIEGPITTVVEGGENGRFWIRNQTLDLISSARPDKVHICAPHAFVINWKTGFKRPTPSELSWQSRTEVVATWHELGGEVGLIKHIRGAFLSSRISSHFDATDYHMENIRRVEREIQHVVWRTQQKDAPRVPGPWCRYCRAQGVCKENATYAMLPAGNQPMTVPGRGGALKADELAVALYVGKMTPREMGFVYQRQSVVDSVFKALKARLLQLPEDQLAQAGYKKVAGNRNKEITDAPTAFSRLSAILTDEERWQCVRIVRGAVTDSVADRLGITKKEAEERVLAAMGDVVVDKPGNPKLKPL
jgi:hypothetical protein